MKNQVKQLLKEWVNLHLDIIVDRMKREFKVEANIGAPQVAYRETILGLAQRELIFIKNKVVEQVNLQK